jgi:Bacterial membrane protein N terminal
VALPYNPPQPSRHPEAYIYMRGPCQASCRRRGSAYAASNQSGGPWGSGSKPSDLDEFLRLSQDKLGSLLPGNLGGRGIALIALAAVALWGFSGFFRVEPDELGVVMRFGKFQREAPPGLNYPIETVLTPQALRINKIDIGFNLLRGSAMRDVRRSILPRRCSTHSATCRRPVRIWNAQRTKPRPMPTA